MIFNPTPIEGAYLIDIEPRADERGMFTRIFCTRELKEKGIEFEVVQGNVSRCASKGTIRGLHWQMEPHGEQKFFRCTHGEIFQAFVDVRPDSSSYLKWFGARLDAEGGRMFYVPTGCASGYQALTDGAEVTYLVSAFYNPESERGIRWNDPAFNIDWPIRDGVILSPKDKVWPDYHQ
jgi:dTDP-4-dehydrorhamnose 3,5-epimerase